MAEQTQELDLITENQTRPRPSWGRIAAWSGLIALLVLIGAAMFIRFLGNAAQGDKAPFVNLTTFDGQQITYAELKGKVIVLNFWASWCNPCEDEAADLEAAWRYYKDSGQVVFIGIDYADTDREAKAYLDRFDITYLNGPDLGGKMSQAYRIRGVPETYIIDQNGRIANTMIGPFTSLSQIQGMIDPLLSTTQ
jgi:cytochrome c biogenesis protein CcmG/thiol:disulfide interchange protein DsbE